MSKLHAARIRESNGSPRVLTPQTDKLNNRHAQRRCRLTAAGNPSPSKYHDKEEHRRRKAREPLARMREA